MTKVLIVEDDANILNQYVFYLTQRGYQVLAAKDAVEGLEMEKQGPDVIILDLLMPGMSGLDFMRKLPEAIGPNPIPKVIVLTNTESPHVRDEVMALGVKKYLLKVDYTPAQLAAEVEEVLSDKPSPSAEQPPTAEQSDS